VYLLAGILAMVAARLAATPRSPIS
jgi:hypothetical protein